MHGHVEAAARRPAADAALDRARAEPAAALTDEKGAVPSLARALRSPSQARSASTALPPTGNTRVFEPLPSTRTVRSARSRSVTSRPASSARRSPDEYRSSSIARSRCERASVGLRASRLADLVDVERLRQPLRGLRRADLDGGIGLEDLFADQVVEEAAQRRQPALDAARTEPVAVLARGEGADVMGCRCASSRRSSRRRSTSRAHPGRGDRRPRCEARAGVRSADGPGSARSRRPPWAASGPSPGRVPRRSAPRCGRGIPCSSSG